MKNVAKIGVGVFLTVFVCGSLAFAAVKDVITPNFQGTIQENTAGASAYIFMDGIWTYAGNVVMRGTQEINKENTNTVTVKNMVVESPDYNGVLSFNSNEVAGSITDSYEFKDGIWSNNDKDKTESFRGTMETQTVKDGKKTSVSTNKHGVMEAGDFTGDLIFNIRSTKEGNTITRSSSEFKDGIWKIDSKGGYFRGTEETQSENGQYTITKNGVVESVLFRGIVQYNFTRDSKKSESYEFKDGIWLLNNGVVLRGTVETRNVNGKITMTANRVVVGK